MHDHNKLLLVDKNAKRRHILQHFLNGADVPTEEVPSLEEAMRRIHQDSFAMALISQAAFAGEPPLSLRTMRASKSDISIILMAKIGNPEAAVSLVEKGIVDHITSPDNLAAIYSAVLNEFEKKKLLRNHKSDLKKYRKLKEEQRKNLKRAADLEEIYDSTLENLMTALDLRDVETYGHSKTVARYTQLLARVLGITDDCKLNNIRTGSLLHDVGKIAIPDSILKKTDPLTNKDWEKIRMHPVLGYGLIKEIKLLDEVGNIILYHHERYDGTGYPKKLKKEEIPVEARVFALADALDAITSHRPYRRERSFSTARKEIQAGAGTQFDPEIVEAFSSVDMDMWEKIRYETTKLIPYAENFIS
ncbi:MAG: HD domain-containing protein [Candidatus Aminicenantes bacterium]|nr:HD domain-containing protein [Candidatus Aminicenantes bacterium]